MDSEGGCASVTCSNGTGSGLIVPGTGVHVNNMLGEEDLNPQGFHRWEPGSRLPSMMSPTVILRDGELEAGLGSAGSNRIRSAVLQTILRLVADGWPLMRPVQSPRVHFEAGALHAEPGIDADALERIEAQGVPVERWKEPNMFFGGVQAVCAIPRRASWERPETQGAAERSSPSPARPWTGRDEGSARSMKVTLPFIFAASAISRERLSIPTRS